MPIVNKRLGLRRFRKAPGKVRPIFVLGSPRSGTTLLGNYVGSARSVCHLAEYGAFAYVHGVIPERYKLYHSTPYQGRYLAEIQAHAESFAKRVALEKGCTYFCDSSPSTLFVIPFLVPLMTDALFILTVRHYSGVLQSLGRAFDNGYPQAGGTWAERAGFWSSFYRTAPFLPPGRTVSMSYDRLCADPPATIAQLKQDLATKGFDVSQLDDGVFAEQHAVLNERRATIGASAGSDGLSMRSIPSFDPERWSAAIQEEVYPVVRETDEALRQHFPAVYMEPAGFEAASRAAQPA